MQLLTAVVSLAEHAGKPVKPVIVPTNEPFYARSRHGDANRRPGADRWGNRTSTAPRDQLDIVVLYWLNVCGAKPEPLSIRVLGKDRDAAVAGHRRRQPDPQARGRRRRVGA